MPTRAAVTGKSRAKLVGSRLVGQACNGVVVVGVLKVSRLEGDRPSAVGAEGNARRLLRTLLKAGAGGLKANAPRERLQLQHTT